MDRMAVIGLIATLIQVSLIVAVPLLLIWVVRWIASGRWRRLAALFNGPAAVHASARPATPQVILPRSKRSRAVEFDYRSSELSVTTGKKNPAKPPFPVCWEDEEDY